MQVCFRTALLFACVIVLVIAYGQNAVVGTGFSSGWGGSSCPTGTGNFKYLSGSAGGSYILTTNANSTGNQYFRFGVDWSGTTAQLANTPGSDVSINTGQTYTLNANCTTAGAMYLNVASTAYNYIFKTLNAGTNPTGTYVVFEVQGNVRSVSSVNQSPASMAVTPGSAVTVTANLDGSLSTGQQVYLRYATNSGFSTSSVVPMTGSGATYTASIPAGTNTAGTTVYYYVFTSGPSNVASNGSNADLYTINLNNNGGSNYSYTVLSPSTIYQHNFGTSTISTYPYAVSPTSVGGILNSSLINVGWSNANNTTWTSYNGNTGAPSQAIALIDAFSGSLPWQLQFSVLSGYAADITSISLWRQSSQSGNTISSILINGTEALSSSLTIPTTGSTTSVALATPIQALNGPVTISITLSNGGSGGSFRIDDFTLNGYVYPIAGPVASIQSPVGTTISNGGSRASFGNITVGQSGDYVVRISNLGGSNSLSVSNINFSGIHASDFSLVSPPVFPLVIAPGGSQDVTVRVAPGATGSRSATMLFSCNDVLGNTNYSINLSATGIASSGSDIIDNTDYATGSPEFNSNPSYINFIDGSASTSGKIIAMKFKIRDGGPGLNDADNIGTTLTDISFNVTNTGGTARANFIKQALLTTSGGAVIAAASSITASQIVFTGLNNANLSVADNSQTATNLHLRVSFNEANVTDNEKLVYSIASATASSSGSQFATANAGGAQTDNSTSNDRNRIEVVATKLAFVQQPGNTGFGQTMTPSPTVEAIDVNGRRDLDFTGSISLTSTGTMTGSPLSVNAVSGLAIYNSVVHTVLQTGRTLTATAAGLTSIVSNTFDINASSGTTDYFRTATGFSSGNWNSTSSWESSPDNTTWVPATIIPNSSASAITIRSGTLTIAAAASAKALMVQTGAVLVHSSGVSFTIADDGTSAADFVVSGRYELNGDQPTLNAGATCSINSLGEVRVNSNSGGQSDNFARNTSVTWLDGSIFSWNVASISSFEASGEIYFPNTPANVVPVFRVLSNPGTIGGTGVTIINGRFECNGAITFQSATAIVFRNGVSGTGTITQSSTCGQFRITGTTSQLGSGSGTLTLNLRNDVSSGLALQAGTCTMPGNFTSNTGPIYIDGGATLVASTYTISGSGSFTLNSSATLVSAHANGVNGSVALSGTKIFNDGANYTFNGSTNQNTGTLMGTTIGTLTISNTNTVTLSNNNHTATTLNLNAGLFRCGTNQNLNIANGGSINSTGGNQPNDPTAGAITFLGSGQTTGSNTGEPKLYDVTINGSIDFNGSSNTQSATIWKRLQIKASGFVIDAPFYHNSSTLVYNIGSSYNRSVEWGQPTVGAQGYPYNVLVQNGTTLNLANNPLTSLEIGGNLSIGTSASNDNGNKVDMNAATIPLRILGNLTIGDPSTSMNRLTMSTANGGNLELYGNFTRYKFNNYYDNEAYNGGRGRSTIFKGSGTSVVDIIDANDPANEVQKFHKLVMDKTGFGDVTLLVPNLFIESELELINGVMHTMMGTPPGSPGAPPGLSYGLITLESNAVVTGTTSSGCFVDGQFAKQFGTSTTAEFIFPVGKLGAPIPNRPFWFTKTNNAAGTMRGEYFYYEPPHKSFDYFASSLMGIVNTEYWQFDKNAGDISGKIILDYKNPGAGNWRGPGGLTGVDPCSNCNVAVVKRSTDFSTGIWDFTSLSGVFASMPATLPEYRWYQDNGRITSSVISSFSPFTIGYSYNVVLGNALQSSKLLAFGGLLQNGNGLLHWQVDRTADLREFVLQHSTDGVQFEPIAKLPASGLYYNFTHPHLSPGKHYYRLHVIEANGRSYYSQLIELVVHSAPTFITGIQSSVVHSQLTVLIWSESNQAAKATIYDRAGRLISQQQQLLQPGNNQWPVPVALLATGLYYIEIQTADGARKTLRWLKE